MNPLNRLRCAVIRSLSTEFIVDFFLIYGVSFGKVSILCKICVLFVVEVETLLDKCNSFRIGFGMGGIDQIDSTGSEVFYIFFTASLLLAAMMSEAGSRSPAGR